MNSYVKCTAFTYYSKQPKIKSVPHANIFSNKSVPKGLNYILLYLRDANIIHQKTRPERKTHYLLNMRTIVLPQNLKLINRKRIQSRDSVLTRQSERLLKEHDNTCSQNLELINRKRIQSRDGVSTRQSERLAIRNIRR